LSASTTSASEAEQSADLGELVGGVHAGGRMRDRAHRDPDAGFEPGQLLEILRRAAIARRSPSAVNAYTPTCWSHGPRHGMAAREKYSAFPAGSDTTFTRWGSCGSPANGAARVPIGAEPTAPAATATCAESSRG
jgi:hypothetical protein